MFTIRKTMLCSILLLAILTVVGCSTDSDDISSNENGSNENNETENAETEIEENREPITLTMMMWEDWGQDYQKNIKEAVEEEFPHITLENVGGDTGNQEWIEEALAAGIVPDLIFAHRQYHVQLLEDYQLGHDMTDLIESHNFDLSRYDEEHLQEWASWTNGEIWLLPFSKDVYGLSYNKDVFDTFGVDYPTDNMTWEEVIDLAKQVTGERDGTHYQGLHLANNGHLPITQVLGTTQLIDPETDEVLWTEHPLVRKWLEYVEEVHNLPGNEFPDGDGHAWSETRTLAMRPLWLDMDTSEELNWDIVTYPQWEEAPGVGPLAGGWALGVTAPSEHKDAAFEVLNFLYSDERIGYLGPASIWGPYPHLHDSGQSTEQLDEERYPTLLEKNLDALYHLKPAGGPESRSKYDIGAFSQIEHFATEFIESELDVNSYLRELKELEEIRILEEKGRQ